MEFMTQTDAVPHLPADVSHVLRATPPPAPILHSAEDAPEPVSDESERKLRRIVRDVWEARELLQQLTLRDIRIRYKQAVMGFGWALFMPLLVLMAGMLVRYSMSQVAMGSAQLSQLSGLMIKALAWSFFVGAIGFATPSLVSNQNLVTKIYFPREVLPTASVLAQLFDSGIGALILLAILPFTGIAWGWTLAWAPLLVLLLVTFTMAASLFLSCANLFFRDVKYIVQVLLTFGIFATPVFLDAVMFGPVGAKLIMLNPLSPLLEGLRVSVVLGHDLTRELIVTNNRGVPVTIWSPLYLVYSSTWAVLGLVGSLLFFRRTSSSFAEYA